MDLAWTLAFVVGTGTSLIELLSRYRDEPFKVIATSQFAWFYLSLNGMLAIGADYALVHSQFGDAAATTTGRAGLALVAGLGAAVILRSRVFTAQLGDEQVSIGPGYIVDQLLQIIDAQIDRRRALQRVQIVVEVMRDKEFEGSKIHVSNMIVGSRQNLSLQAQEDLANQIREVSDRKVPDQERSYALGFILLDFMGERFFRAVANELPTVPHREPSEVVDLEAVDLTATGKLQVRNWGGSLPIHRANLVRELLSGVGLERVSTHIEELVHDHAVGRDEGERNAIVHEIDRILARDDTNEEEKVFGLGFVIHAHVDRRTFRELFQHLQEEPSDHADRPSTGRHPTIGAPAGPLPVAGSEG